MSCIGIDVGTSNVKVVLCDGDLVLVDLVTAPLVTERSGASATQDAGALWDAVLGAMAELVARNPVEAAAVTHVGVCAQYSSIIPVSSDLTPVGPMITYLDPRGTEASFAIAERHPDAFERWMDIHGIPPIGSGLSLGHILWCEARPELAAATTWYLEPVDYVVARLTGTVAATQGTVFTGQLCDNRTLGATTYHEDLLAMAGVDPGRLPPLVAPATVVGGLTTGVASATGLAPTVEVRAGLNDSQAGALATGAFRSGRGGVAIGTTSVVFDAVGAKAEDLDHEVVTMPGPLGDQWLVWAENGLAGRSVQAVLDWLTPAGISTGGNGHHDPFAELEPALAASPPGSNGVVFGPQLSGSMSPVADSAVRGSLLGLSLDTTRADLIRAAVEGTALNLAWLLDVVEGFTGQRLDQLTFAGGAARSPGWAQTIADACGRPVTVLERPEAAVARAAAFWGALGPDAEPALATGTVSPVAGPEATGTASVRHRFAPDEVAGGALARGREVFLAAFEALRPVYRDIAQSPTDQES